MISKIRSRVESRVESRLEADKLCGWPGGAPRQTSRQPGRARINPAAAKDTLHQINVKGFASRPNGSSNVAWRLMLELPKSGPTLDIILVPRGWPLSGLMLTDQCSQSIPQTRGSDFGVQQRSCEQLSQLRQTGFILTEVEPVSSAVSRSLRVPRNTHREVAVTRRGWLARKTISPPARA